MFATRDLMRACARSGLCLSTAVAFRPCEKSCIYIAPRTPAPEHSLTRGSRRAFNPDLGHLDLSQPGARDDQGHRQHASSPTWTAPLHTTKKEGRDSLSLCAGRWSCARPAAQWNLLCSCPPSSSRVVRTRPLAPVYPAQHRCTLSLSPFPREARLARGRTPLVARRAPHEARAPPTRSRRRLHLTRSRRRLHLTRSRRRRC